MQLLQAVENSELVVVLAVCSAYLVSPTAVSSVNLSISMILSVTFASSLHSASDSANLNFSFHQIFLPLPAANHRCQH